MPDYEPTPTRGGGPIPTTPPKEQPTTAKPKTTTKGGGKGGTTVGQQNTETMPQEITQALSPYEDVLNALPGEYQSAMAGVNAGMQSESSTGNAGLDAAIKGVNQSVMAGEGGVETALKGLGKAGATLEKDLPYSDVLSTLLTEKKNELQYGTIPTYTVSTSHWSDPLKDIYKYIEGKAAGTSGAGGTTPGAPALPSIQAAAGGTTGSGSVPGSGGPGLGQG